MAKVCLNGIDVEIKRCGLGKEHVGGKAKYRVEGVVKGVHIISGIVTFWDGGDFDNNTNVDDKVIVDIFTQLDEQGWDV
jgi:hypothetical protein